MQEVGAFLAMRSFFRYVASGIVIGTLAGVLLSLVSGNIFVVEFVGTLGVLVGVVLGIVHRNDV
jgi:hypothetical protein